MKIIHLIYVMVIAIALLVISAPAIASEADDGIESSARNSYVFKTYLKFDDIKIQSKDGVVTLTGVVSEESRRGLAKETVAGLPGVRSVDNRLEVKGAAPTPNSDAWLSEKVKAILSFHRSASASAIEVGVKSGIVTLRGDADSRAQKDLMTEYAKDVEGVKDVNNQMNVSKNSKTTITKVIEEIDDASITAQVKMSLLYHGSTSAINTKVETNKGVVTLYGKARTGAEKTLAGKYANDISGVKSVDNRMTIE